jgi:hypothetical protein
MSKKIEFAELGVTFYFPKSMENVHVRNFGKPKSLLHDPAGVFVNIDKAIIRFEFVDPETGKKPEVIDSFKMKVKFKQSHLPPGGFPDLQLGINKGSGWINLTAKSKKTRYSRNYQSTWRGNFKVKIDGEADPEMAWGP